MTALLPPTASSFARDFGLDSQAFVVTAARLRQALRDLAGEPLLRMHQDAWAEGVRTSYGGGDPPEELFVRHTYLALLAPLLVFTAMEHRTPAGREAAAVLGGTWFAGRGIANLVDDGCFRWPLLVSGPRLHGTLADLAGRLAAYDLRAVREDLLKPVYEQLVGEKTRHGLGEFYTPGWLAEEVVEAALGPWPAAGRQPRVLDPTCGSGSFLRAVIGRLRARSAGDREEDLLQRLQQRVAGMDVNPLAVAVAKATWLLAVADLLPDAREAVRVPVDMGDALCTEDRRFDLVVGNPPWLTIADVTDPGQRELMRCRAKETGVAPRTAGEQAHTELATLFLAQAFRQFLVTGDDDGRPGLAFVMPRSVFTATHHRALREGTYGVRFDVAGLWDLAAVDPLFKVPSCVLFAAACAPAPERPKPGRVYRGRLPSPDPDPSVATERLQRETAVFVLDRLGRRSAWRPLARSATAAEATGPDHPPDHGATAAEATGPDHPPDHGATAGGVAGRAGSPYRARFRQGAVLYPQTLLGALPVGGRGPGEVVVETDPAARATAKVLRDTHLRAVVERAALCSTPAAEHLLPHTLAPVLWTVVLPVLACPGDPAFQVAGPDELRRHGRAGAAGWFEAAERAWRRVRTRPGPPLWERLDHLGHLSAQARRDRWLVLYTSAGSRPVAAVVDSTGTEYPLVVRDQTYWASFHDPAEAHYLAAILNSDQAANRIRGFMTTGLFGPRHIHKRVLDLPIPAYDPAAAVHAELSVLGARLASSAAGAAHALPAGAQNPRRLVREVLPADASTRVEELAGELLSRSSR